MMMRMAKTIGRPTSAQARDTAWRRPSSSASGRRSTRSTFSTTTRVPSTIMPMAMARPPRDMRLAEMPNQPMPRVAKSTEKGMERATTRLGRALPMKTISTTVTRTMPCTRASVTVATQAATRVFCS